jgi:hypothetical protein
MRAWIASATAATLLLSGLCLEVQAGRRCNDPAATPYAVGLMPMYMGDVPTAIVRYGNDEAQEFNPHTYNAGTERGRLIVDGLVMTLLDGKKFSGWDQSHDFHLCIFTDELQLVNE